MPIEIRLQKAENQQLNLALAKIKGEIFYRLKKRFKFILSL